MSGGCRSHCILAEQLIRVSLQMAADRILAEQLSAGEQFIAGAASEATAKAKPKAKAKESVIGADGRVLVPRSKVRSQPLRYYAVVSGPPDLLGVWHATWATLEGRLPGGRLAGSGVRLFGFNTQLDADRRWSDYWESDPVRQPRS